MDEFKKYIQNNKEQLDEDVPSSMVWSNIESSINKDLAYPKNNFRVLTLVRWAVAACVLGLAGIGSWYLFTSKQPAFSIDHSVVKTMPKPFIEVTLAIDSSQKNNSISNIEPAFNVSNNLKEKRSPKTNSIIILSQQDRSVQPKNDPTYTALLNNVETTFTQVINLQKARISTYPMYAESADYFKDFNIQINQMEKEEKDIKSIISRRGINDDLLDQLIHLYQQKLSILKQLQLEMNKTNNRFKQNRGPVDTTRSYFLSI